MLGYNTAIYDDVDKNCNLIVSCYIKYSNNHFTYLQPVANISDKDIGIDEDNHIIIEESMVYSSPEML